jgi:hypothetical protein
MFYYSGDEYDVKAFSHDPPTEDWENAEVAEEEQLKGAEEAVRGKGEGDAIPTSEEVHAATMIAGLEGEGKLPTVAPKDLEELGQKQEKKLEQIIDNLATNPALIGRLADRIGAQAFVPLLKRDTTVDPLHRVLEEDDR